MDFITTKEKLLNAALIAERITGKKESLPVLSCIHLSTSGRDLVLQSTNLEAGVKLRVLGELKSSGVVAVPSTVFVQTLRAASGDHVVLRSIDSNLLVESRGSNTLIKCIPADEFPSIAANDDACGVLLPKADILSGIQSVLYAASSSMIRPELGSILVSIEDKSLTTVATDSFRLAEKSMRLETGEESSILIPLKHAIELTHVLDKITDVTVSVVVDDSQLTIRSEFVTFVSRVVDARFPNYKDILPKSFVTEAVVLKGDLTDLLRKARVFSGADQRIGLHVYPKRRIFSATAQSPEVGEMSDSLEASLSGDDIDIFFNIGYISDCLTSISSDSVALKFAGPGRPLVVRGVSDETFTYLVMPLNR